MKITEYKVLGKLPDPFTFEDGRKVTCREDWSERRAELYKTAVELQFGVIPPEPEFLELTPLYITEEPYRMKSYRVTTGPRSHPVSFVLYIHQPKHPGGQLPAIVDGDHCWHTVTQDEVLREIADHDYLFVTFNRTELACDYVPLGRTGPLFDAYPDGNFSVIAAWAWGYSRCVDALEALGIADMAHIAFTGLSRGAKTALLAGAVDERAFLVNPEATCAGGGGCYRVHMKAVTMDGEENRSETLDDIVTAFPAWFNSAFGEYKRREAELPFDCHYMKALVAPRILFSSEASSDMWANPLGVYQTSVAAREVWKLLGDENDILWYWREGYHDQTPGDFGMLLNLMDHAIHGTPLDERFFKLPFEAPEPIYDWHCPETK